MITEYVELCQSYAQKAIGTSVILKSQKGYNLSSRLWFDHCAIEAWTPDLSRSSHFLSYYHTYNRFVIHICSMTK